MPNGDNSIPDFGEEARAKPRQVAGAAFVAFMRARSDGEWSKMCEGLARPALRQMDSLVRASNGKLKGCGAVLGALLAQRSRRELADTVTNGIEVLRVKGNTAFALFYGPSATKYVMPMQREGGRWKMTQLAPLPYPLGTAAPSP